MLQETITIDVIRTYIPNLKQALTTSQISDLKGVLIGNADRINGILELRPISPLELFASMGGAAASRVLEILPKDIRNITK